MVSFQSPLQWIPHQKRTKFPRRALFGNHSAYKAGNELESELKLLEAKDVIISSDLQVKQDGTLCARQYNEDMGVVIYFKLKGQDKAMACDKWDKPEHNLWALKLSIAAIRGLERWGGSELLDGLFTGFQALPGPGDIVIVGKQYFSTVENMEDLKILYKKYVKELHPDVGGDPSEFSDMNRQYNQRKEGFT